jgi:hypothetical protein
MKNTKSNKSNKSNNAQLTNDELDAWLDAEVMTIHNAVPKINTLLDEAVLLGVLNQYRDQNNLAGARNGYSWWKYVLTSLLVTKESKGYSGVTLNDAVETVRVRLGVNVKASATLLSDAVGGELPDPVRREYTNSLPGIVKATGLRVWVAPDRDQRRGRAPLLFAFKDRDKARQALFAHVPETRMLFKALKRVNRIPVGPAASAPFRSADGKKLLVS